MRGIVTLALVGLLGGASPLRGQAPAAGGSDADRRTERYRIGTMERVLENAVEHGATVTRDRLRALIPADVLLSEEAKARGFRLAGYGVFFDVLVPTLEGSLPWIYRTLDQTDLGLQSALKTLRAMVDAQGSDPELQQALRRLELQVAPYAAAAERSASARGSAAADASPAASRAADPILSNPVEAYRAEVMEAVIDAMLTHSRALELAAGEWLTVGARRDGGARIGVGDSPARTLQISVRADDLKAYLAGQITREQARARMDVRVF
jgi:hypothetical protein